MFHIETLFKKKLLKLFYILLIIHLLINSSDLYFMNYLVFLSFVIPLVFFIYLQLAKLTLTDCSLNSFRGSLSLSLSLSSNIAVLMEGRVRYLMPEGGDWTVIEELVNILEPFQKVTEAMSTEKYPTISSVKPLLYKLLERVLKVEDSDSSISKQMKKPEGDQIRSWWEVPIF